jgi:hypothetical protein
MHTLSVPYSSLVVSSSKALYGYTDDIVQIFSTSCPVEKLELPTELERFRTTI